uniref:Uncharacterized protein n=1 Tax=viral metagenome TaxID=1070528 RepID=A0A6C0J379_9ZZZZ
MINYTSLEEAWGLEDVNVQKNKEENNIIKSKNEELVDNTVNIVKDAFQNELNELNKCDAIDHILSCDKCLDKLKQTLKIEQKIIIEKPINKNIKNKLFLNNIEGFNFKIPYNKHLVLYITIIGILILSILLVHSYRRPVRMNTNHKKFYIFPEDIDKLKSLIDIARN